MIGDSTTPGREMLRANRWFIVLEMALVAGVFVADSHHHIYLSKTPYLIALGWISLMIRGQRWRDVGLSIPANWQRLLLIGILVGVAMEFLELFATQPLLVALTGKYPDLSVLRELVGNVPMLLIAVGASWLLAAFGEELVWRGYVLNRILDLIGRTRLGWLVSVAVVSVVFGLAHAYQDWTGIIENTIDGALLAALYINCGRNLFAPIVAHGVTDTLDSLIIFFGHYPGMN
ncbi:MAG: CPBP family intramembrane glutamic endopeptidase [Steroidobacteraceae bacterium]